MTLLSINGLRVAYRDHVAVDGVGLDLEPGRITAVVGESGSGKSTLAHAIIGLLPGTGKVLGGSIRLDGEELVGLSAKAWRSVRGRRIGLVPQDPGVALDPTQPVGRQVAEVLKVHGLSGGPRVVELLAEAGLPEPEVRARQYPHELSGGMRQRVLIAMATAARPRLLVADEPTSALDVTVQRQILDHLEHLANTTGTAILLVTHDLAVAAERAQRIVVMRNARVVEAGPTEEILHAPSDPYTQRLLSDNPATARPRPRPVQRPEVLLEVRELSKTFPIRGSGLRRQHRTAVDAVSFDVPRGQTLGLVGESGSGKTTTARLVLGLDRPTAGTVRLGGTDVTAADRAQLRRLHRRIQLIYQNPYASLNPRFTVREILTEPLRNFGITDGPGVTELLDSVALPAATATRKAAELSGGQRQRVAIARALSLNPELVVCDEPVSALDVTVQAQILDLLVTLQRDRGLSYLFISHDLAVVRHVSDRIAVMRHGRIVETGTTEDIFTAARHPYTQSLLDAVPGITEEEASWT
ncbi:dipeptide ABC transporter ATP-binding protein [Amycolatopsis sp. lyj-109]|uniref:dipeptide ABC transporter ATP-binding protein n=1 Tax=Amycolatopsis sp. lyj-109 TaxID=2789287 RepID=UPI00397B3195